MLANRIILLRKYRGLSQAQLARMLHISASAEGMYEQGRRTPSIDVLIGMSKQFNVSLDYLLTGEEFQNGPEKTLEVLTAIQCPCRSCGCKRKCSNK